jgi:hypothetical protein
MIKTQYEFWGAQTILTLRGEPQELERTVNLYSSFGMFTSEAIPSEYDPAKHSKVVIAATTKNVLPSLQALVEFRMANSPEFADERKALKGKSGTVFQSLAKERAEAIYAEFERASLKTVEGEKDLRDQRDYTLRDDEITPYMRKQGRQILAAISGAKRDAAKGAARVSAE